MLCPPLPDHSSAQFGSLAHAFPPSLPPSLADAKSCSNQLFRVCIKDSIHFRRMLSAETSLNPATAADGGGQPGAQFLHLAYEAMHVGFSM